MKIGIITIIDKNYGNRLQNYAAQEVLKQYGEVETIPFVKRDKQVFGRWIIKKLLYNIKHTFCSLLKKLNKHAFFLKGLDSYQSVFHT